MRTHIFAVCAYGESPYLEECIRSLKRQTLRTRIILCTSTPCEYIARIAEKYGLPLCVRDGVSDIQDDWNFAYEKADAELVTIAHQDDRYHSRYAERVQACWGRYPDTTVFMTGCAVLKDRKLQSPDRTALIKCLLRLPLRLHGLADHRIVKRAALRFGNPVICPSCTYCKAALGAPLFQSPYRFALDWDTLWTLAGRPGRFYCEERPLIAYRIHGGSETEKCMESSRRQEEETAMFSRLWPEPAAKLLMHFYRKAGDAYRQAL